MTLRKAASDRENPAVHYFYEGAQTTVCGLSMDTFRVKNNDEPLTCRHCAAEMARIKREERAS